MSHSGHAVVTPFDIGKGGERNTLGGYLVLMGSLAGGMFLYSERKIEKTILLCLLILIVVTLMLSISRSGWIGFFVASFILFITTKKHKAYFVVALFFLLTLPFIVPNVVRNRFLETFNQVSQGNQVTFLGLKFDTSFSARIASIGHVFRDFSKSPFLGRGITGYYFVDGQYIRNLAEVGILGSLAFFLILFTTHGIIRNAKKILSENTQFQGIIIGLNAGFFGLLVHALSANTFIIIKICEPFWCLVGLITVATILEQERRIKNEPSYKDLVEIAHNRKLQLVNCQKKNSERVQNFVRSADIRMI
jgi:O-antigen ligase